MDPIVAMAALRRELERRLSVVKRALSLRSVREFVHKLQVRLVPSEGIEDELQRLQDSYGQCKAGFTAEDGSGGYGNCRNNRGGYDCGGYGNRWDYSGTATAGTGTCKAGF